METYTEWIYDSRVESDIDDVLLIVMDMEQAFFVPEGWIEDNEVWEIGNSDA